MNKTRTTLIIKKNTQTTTKHSGVSGKDVARLLYIGHIEVARLLSISNIHLLQHALFQFVCNHHHPHSHRRRMVTMLFTATNGLNQNVTTFLQKDQTPSFISLSLYHQEISFDKISEETRWSNVLIDSRR